MTTGKSKAPADTSLEPKYLRFMIDGKRRVRVKTTANEEFEGVIEYYDERFIRLTRAGKPNLFLFKQDLKYIAEISE